MHPMYPATKDVSILRLLRKTDTFGTKNGRCKPNDLFSGDVTACVRRDVAAERRSGHLPRLPRRLSVLVS